MAEVQEYTSTLTVISCIECGCHFGIDSHMNAKLRTTGNNFYCPAGHAQRYTVTETMKLRNDVTRLKARMDQQQAEITYQQRLRETARRRLAASKGQMTKLKKRIHNGVCPCCKRSFSNLERHMKGQHPDYIEGETP